MLRQGDLPDVLADMISTMPLVGNKLVLIDHLDTPVLFQTASILFQTLEFIS